MNAPFRGLVWFLASLLVRPCVRAVLQQNITIVQRASDFRWKTDSFLCVWKARGANSPDDPPSLPCGQLGGGELRRGLHGDGVCHWVGAESPDRQRIQVTYGAHCLCLWENDWMDGFVTLSQMTGWGAVHVKFQELHVMKECRSRYQFTAVAEWEYE